MPEAQKEHIVLNFILKINTTSYVHLPYFNAICHDSYRTPFYDEIRYTL